MSPSNRQLEERQMRKDRILNGALSVFKAKGLDGATMDEIASNSGFGKATLYYYFKSKEDVAENKQSKKDIEKYHNLHHQLTMNHLQIYILYPSSLNTMLDPLPRRRVFLSMIISLRDIKSLIDLGK